MARRRIQRPRPGARKCHARGRAPRTTVGAMVEGPEIQQRRATRSPATRLFAFLKAYAELKQPGLDRAGDEEWSLPLEDLPVHPAVELCPGRGESDPGPLLLRVRRAEVAPAPLPPPELASRLIDGWDDPARPVLLRDGAAPEGFDGFCAERERWAREQGPAWRARRLYDALFELKGRLDREGERLELLVGNGLLRLQTGER